MATKYHSKPYVTLTTTVPLDYCKKLDEAAESLGISRHKLLRTSLEIGFPLATAKLEYQQATTAAQPRNP